MSATSVRAAALLIVLALAAGCGAAGVPSDPAPSAPVLPEETSASTEPQEPTEAQAGDAGELPAPEPQGSEQPAQELMINPEEPSGAPLPEVPPGEPSQLVVHGDRSCNLVALTYDAGSGADGAAAILDVLREHDLKVTFFLTGRWAEQFPDLARRIADEGHEIGNHTYGHPDLTTISDEEVLQQIRDAEEAIRTATGGNPAPLFREPYGAFSDHERRLVREAGYSYSIYWDVDTLDWTFPGVEATTERILRAQGGSIVLMHMNVADSAAATAAAIPVLQERGYEIAPVSRLLQCGTE